jgi:hypothetical protein
MLDRTCPEDVLDMEAINSDIADGAKAFNLLLKYAADDWNSWSTAIRGLRALRNLAFAQAHTSDVQSYAYRQAISGLLAQPKYSVYGRIDKPTRSRCYKLMDNVEEITTWYIALKPEDQLRWRHPDTVAKHCPQSLLAGGMRGHNKPPKKAKRPPVEVERLKALLVQVIRRLAKHEPEAVELLDQIAPDDPDDSVEEI